MNLSRRAVIATTAAIAAIPLTPAAKPLVALRTEPVIGWTTYALFGERMYCENGDLLSTLLRDVNVGDEVAPDQLKFEPGAVYGMTECPKCGCAVHGGCYYFEVAA
jgi:hypothetical protein